MPLDVPPTNEDGSLRYYTEEELEDIDIRRRGVGGEGDHIAEDLGPDGVGCTRYYDCVWEERFAAALTFVGYAKSYTDGEGKDRISRLLPDVHPSYPDFNWLATKVRITPYRYDGTISEPDFGQGMPNFTRAKLEVTYELLPFELYDDDELADDDEYLRYVTPPGHPGADISGESSYISMPGSIMRYTTPTGTGKPTGIPIPYGIGRPETITKKKLVWRRVPSDLWGPGKTLTVRVKGDGTTRGYIGSLNLTEFYGHPPLTLKLDNVEERLLPDASGLGYAWDLVYNFSEKAVPYGHLGFWFADTDTGSPASGYYQALANGAGGGGASLAAALIDDDEAIFHVREFADLLVVGTV